MDEADRRERIEHTWRHGLDTESAREIYHDDCVLEFPQLGESFVGLSSFARWKRNPPAAADTTVRCIRCRGDLWIAENDLGTSRGAHRFTVNILEFRGDKVAREQVYLSEGWLDAML